MSSKTDTGFEADVEELIDSLSEEELREITIAADQIATRLDEDGPQNPDQLWLWCKKNLGIEIPRHSVCEDHDAPFDFLCAAYFVWHPAIIGMGSRGGGKTFLVALLHWLNSEFKAKMESATFGATEAQSLRCYSHLKDWVYDDEGNRRPQIVSSKMRETLFRNGSKVEVLAGTPEAVNGPHPQVAHGDEVELMREDTWQESRNMAVSKRLEDGTVYRSQEILTSTRKSLHGRMQTLIEGITKAVKLGLTPDYKLFIWCIFEIAEEQPDCQMAPNKERENRLKELGRDPCETCECEMHMKGEWPGGKPRLLKDVCAGKLFRSRGYLPYSDVVQKFKQNSIYTWEAQQECSRPETENNYLKGFSEQRCGVRGFEPDPENGAIYLAVDWGGTNPHAVNWYQLLDRDIMVWDFEGNKLRLIEGSLVVFDEIYKAEIGVDKLANEVISKETRYKARWGENWKPEARFPDPQGKMARLDWKDKGLITEFKTTRDFEVQVEWLVRDWWEPQLLFYCIETVEMWPEEAKSWQKDPNTGNEIEEFNHCMSNLRYCTANIRTRNRHRRRHQQQAKPEAKGRHRTAGVIRDTRNRLAGPIGITGGAPVRDEWRKRLGGPGT